MKYLIVKAKNGLENDSLEVIRDSFDEAISIKKIERIEKLVLIFFDMQEDISISDIFTMLNTELYLDVRAFLSRDFEEIDQEYLDWSIKMFMNCDYGKYLCEEKDILHNMSLCDNSIIKRNVFKSYFNDRDTMNMLRVFFECNLNTSKAADLLYMHRNTLINKLDRFFEVTGYDVRKFGDAAIIYSLI